MQDDRLSGLAVLSIENAEARKLSVHVTADGTGLQLVFTNYPYFCLVKFFPCEQGPFTSLAATAYIHPKEPKLSNKIQRDMRIYHASKKVNL